MKKILYIISVSLFISLLLTSCAPAFPEEIDVGNEQIKNLDGISLNSVDFTDCTVDYHYFMLYSMKDLILGHMPANTVKKFISCLNKAEISLEPDNDYPAEDGGGENDFRIILNTGEVIYIGYDCYYNGDDNFNYIVINGTHYQCDEETFSKLEGWAVTSTPGLKNYLNFLHLEREGKI